MGGRDESLLMFQTACDLQVLPWLGTKKNQSYVGHQDENSRIFANYKLLHEFHGSKPRVFR